ncbi:hypothetical protein EDB83DRAFT_2577696 [Lactarius deliciosus]|nr:hypothetical protein EDB83DRAFT_2577696 [Lactarius deliciosus]
MPPGPFLSSAGWSMDELISRGSRFLKIPRISVSDKNLEVIIHTHESLGVPLVIEGMHEHRAWPATIFNTQWLFENAQQHIQVRDVHNRCDLDVSFADFMDHLESTEPYAGVDETVRWYAKDMECPGEWKKWLETVSPVSHWLRPHGPADIMQNLPECAHVETLMCYLGPGDTFTPFHKDLCASFGHNLMCYAKNGASAFWFMTETSDAWTMAMYLQSLGYELDLEEHAMSVKELAAAPCRVYITEQKAGDLVLVPPRSCHQVVNHGGLTMKMSWSRMTTKSAKIALHHELPIYRRVCRAETYRVKSTIHHTLRRNTALLEDLARTKGLRSYGAFRKQLANDVQATLELFLEIIRDEYHPDADVLGRVMNAFNHNTYDTGGYPGFICDFCSSDIFVSSFWCKDCSLPDENSCGGSDGMHICPGCYVEGRSCRCGRLMDPVLCWPLRILYADYNRAVRALESVGVNKFREIGDHTRITDNGVMGLFEAAIQKWRMEIGKDKVGGCAPRDYQLQYRML